jgi:hypothetical protein
VFHPTIYDIQEDNDHLSAEEIHERVHDAIVEYVQLQGTLHAPAAKRLGPGESIEQCQERMLRELIDHYAEGFDDVGNLWG